MKLEDIERVVAEKRAKVPDAQYAVIVVPKRWADERMGSNVRLVGTLTAKYIGPSDADPTMSLVDLKLSDADAYIEGQRAFAAWCAGGKRGPKPRKRKPSESMLRALRIVEEHGAYLMPSIFSQKMWDTSCWAPHTVGMTGGAYLDRLATMGLIIREDPLYGGACSLTEAGKALLDKHKP